MRMNTLKAILKTATRGAAVLLCGAGLATAQQQVNLTAGRTNTTMPDGSLVPMWNYSCGTSVTGSTAACAALNPNAGNAAVFAPAIPAWSPVVITVPSGQALTINLTNNLSVPTSLTIVGQLGGGLGTPKASPGGPVVHNPQGTTWPIASTGPTFTPPAQIARVQSFATEVAANGGVQSLAWAALNPGTYLIESGTHPSIQGPMGLYGVLVVTTAPGTTAGTAYPGVTYNAEVPLLFSEIDKAQNTAVDTAVATTGFSENTVWTGGPNGCGAHFTCYPPVVNYSPTYYLINGVAFNKANAQASLFPAAVGTATAPVTGNVLVRLVNAGLRMHVPSIVGSQTGTAVAPALPPGGFTLIAEDGNVLPGLPRVQSEVFMAAGKTYDVMINVPAACTPVLPATTCTNSPLPIYDRQLSLSAGSTNRDGGMLAYIGVNGAALPAAAATKTVVANPDTYNTMVAGQPISVSDPGKGVLANDLNVYGATLLTQATSGIVGLNQDGTFSYTPNVGSTATSDSFTYCANGSVIPPAGTAGAACSSKISATVTLAPTNIVDTAGITCTPITYNAPTATTLKVGTPGVLAGCKDAANLKLSVVPGSFAPAFAGGIGVVGDVNGGFTAASAGAGSLTVNFTVQNSIGKTATGTATVVFPAGSGLKVTVLDGSDKTTVITDYRWIIEEDRTFFTDPVCAAAQGQSPLPAQCPTPSTTSPVVNFGTNFHTSFMPVIATGCTGPLSCADAQTVLGATQLAKPRTLPGDVLLDSKKRYYISILPGDAAQPFISGYTSAPDCSTAGVTAGHCGHGMGGAPIPTVPNGGTHSNQAVTVITEPSPYPPATLSVFVFEDDYPLNGEHDAGGGLDTLSPQEPGLGGFQITLDDSAGGTGDPTGTPTYDMFNMPLSNALAGTLDPTNGKDACPISAQATTAGQGGITGMIVTCPKFESDHTTLSPLAGQAVVKNLYPGRYGIIANPGADRIGAGEEWVQTNTLDGQKAHDSFMRIGEPGYFQEFGPAGYHVTIGFANPKLINDRGTAMCTNATGLLACNHEVKGHVTTARMSRTPDERLYGSGNHDAYAFTQCYVSLGDPDGGEFGFQKCDDAGNFDFKNVPPGNWKITTFDQWNDQVVDGITTAVGMCDLSQNSISGVNPTTCKATVDLGEVGVHQWQANVYTRTFLDLNGDGLSNKDTTGTPCTGTNTPAGCNANYGSDTEPGLALVKTNIRFRDGSYSNRNNTDLNGYAGFNEVFPLFNWYVIETDTTRFKNTGTHVVYDSGGPDDNTTPGGVACFPSSTTTKACGNSNIGANLANTYEPNPLPSDLSVPGSVYCTVSDTADCIGRSIATGPVPSVAAGTGKSTMSTGRIDPPWVGTYGWQGFSGQSNFLEFGKKPFAAGENGGIVGHVIYSSTRPFDDPQRLFQNPWEPLVPRVQINLYKEGVAADGITQTLTLVDHTLTSSFDDWAQGFRTDGKPLMNCPGQGTNTTATADPYFWFTLQNQPEWLDVYNSQMNGTAVTPLPYSSQFKCYDGMHNWNELQPAPYDGEYKFPSVTGINTTTGNTTGTNCSICVKDPDATDAFRFGKEDMLPAGKYVVEVVVPQGYELVKEEDKNILIGDNYIAPATQQFGGLGSVFILPDQASINAYYNANNAQNPTVNLGRTPNLPQHEGDTPIFETYWPCVGALRVVPDYISLFPASKEVAPFAGATRPLCDRKEVTLNDQTSTSTRFFIFTQTHAASHFTGQITDDFAAEFDPFSPAFGEKFAPAYLPVAIKDWAGNEVNRVYADQWGAYTGLNYSTWEVNPPNPTGYAPTMMVTCMNDPGHGATVDPLFQSGYSNFCYQLGFMPGQTGYFDTPVVPTSAFAGDYNTPDCAYPDATPAISEVDGDGIGPWVSAAGKTLTITALGDQIVDNYAYSGPSATAAPYNQQKVARHYGFGACTLTAGLCTNGASVKIGGVTALITSWSDTAITVTVPITVPACKIQQQAQYGGSAAMCGELVITASNGKQSIDSVTVTVGGKAPTHVAASATIQGAIDSAMPGDLVIVDPTCTATTGGVTSAVACSTAAPAAGTTVAKSNASHIEMLLMWKPVRLQGVGAASSVIDANPHPAGRLNPWRRQVVCLFGLALNGTAISGTNPYDSPTGFTCPAAMQFSVDRLPLEATVGWTATLNGNLAEQLIEPTIMGAYEGAGITVLGKGVAFPVGSSPFASDIFPTGTTLLDGSNSTTHGCGPNTATAKNPFPSNFYCNPSSIDGLTIKNSSQGGGGILVHGWGHDLQIANNRVLNNQGTLSGGITIGQGEHPDAFLVGAGAVNTPPGSCITNENGLPANLALPYCFDIDVNVHNNLVIQNSSLGDELFSSTPAGAGGVTFCNGSDYYKFNFNWICGNMSTGDGAGVAHIGLSYDGDIEHNSILYNQSTNPTIQTNGGGLLIMGAPDQDPPCGITTDLDCISPAGTISPSDGSGPGLVINANLILGNSADSGSGGGLRLQHINGTEVLNFPKGNVNTNWPQISGHQAQPEFQHDTAWNAIRATNNIIANNVAGWDGAGVSIQDGLAVDFINNTVVSNNSTASSGVLLQSLFAPLASTPDKNCTNNNGANSCPQVAGLVSVTNSEVLTANMSQLTGGTASVVCPVNHGTYNSTSDCTKYSVPVLYNDFFWQNRSLMVGVGGLAGGQTNQNSQVTMYNSPFGGTIATAAASQQHTGDCNDSNASYWDIGIRGDTAPGTHTAGMLSPIYSVLTNGTYSEVGAGSNDVLAPSAAVTSAFCNGARGPVEAVTSGAVPFAAGWQVPPGTNESNALPSPVFTLQPAATVDEGNNWINLRWGPLSTNLASINPAFIFNPSPAVGSPAINDVPPGSLQGQAAPATDFYGNTRPSGPGIDIGAVEIQGGAAPVVTITPSSLAFGNVVATTTSAAQTLTLRNTGNAAFNISTIVVTAPFARAGGTCVATLIAGNQCTIRVTYSPTVAGASSGTLTVTGTNGTTGVGAGNPIGVVNSPVALSGTGVAAVISATLTPTTWAPTAARGVGTGFFQCLLGGGPCQVFTLTNTGNVPLTGVTQGALGGVNVSDFTVDGIASTCGPNGAPNGQIVGPRTTLAVGGQCYVTVQFRPLVTEPLNSVSATISVTDLAGMQTSNLTGTVTGNQGSSLTSITPISGVRGTTTAITLTGVNLQAATAVNMTGATCTITGPAPRTSTTLTANCAITAGAGLGNRNVTVTAPAGPSNGVAFRVAGATIGFTGPASMTTTPGNTTTKTGIIAVNNTATGANAGSFTFTAAPTAAKASGGTGTGTFTVTGGTCVSGFVLSAGSNCTITVQYAGQTSTATATGRVTITGTGLTAATQTSATFNAN